MAQVSPIMGLVMGGIFAAVGLAVVFLGLGWIPIDPSRVHAPMWVIGLSGMAFLLPGLLICYYGVRNGFAGDLPHPAAERDTVGGPNWLVGVLMVSISAAVSLWAGFGAGPREFSGGLSGSEWEGRIVFGLAGLVCGAIATAMWVQGIRKLLGARD